MVTLMTIMVMKRHTTVVPLRVGVAEAKAGLSRLLRGVDQQPVVIHNRGRDVARLVGAGRPLAASDGEPRPFVDFFARLEVVRKRLKLQGVDFRPKKAVLRLENPFGDEE